MALRDARAHPRLSRAAAVGSMPASMSRKRRTAIPTLRQPTRASCRATATLEREREVCGQLFLEGGPYRASVARSLRTYEAWTESQPFLYGRPADSAQGALYDLHRQVEAWRRERDEAPRA